MGFGTPMEETQQVSVCVFQVGGLASENVRWAEAVENFRKQERTMCGDVLLITAFISYLGYFTKRYRLQLMDNTWRPYLSQLKVRDFDRTEHLYPLITDTSATFAVQSLIHQLILASLFQRFPYR